MKTKDLRQGVTMGPSEDLLVANDDRDIISPTQYRALILAVTLESGSEKNPDLIRRLSRHL